MIAQHVRLACLIALAAFPLTGAPLAMAATPEPAYSVNETDSDIEIRTYEPMIVAEVDMAGERSGAINAGFRVLADYIFGNNKPKQKIEMTAPVTQQSAAASAGEKIEMTAPVTQQGNGETWVVRFVMPKGTTLETLPAPNDPRVRLVARPAQRIAAIRFSGWSTDSNLQEHRDKLLAWIEKRKLPTSGPPVAAFYNPPWTLPFWRRNEFLIELKL